MKKYTLFTLIAMLLLSAIPLLAQDEAAEEEEPPECPAFEDSSADVRRSYYMGEGTAFIDAGQTSRAIESFTCIVELIDPSYAPAYIERAAAYTNRRLYEDAIEDFTALIDLGERTVVAYNNRGIVHVAMNEYELALADFDSALGIDASYVPSLNNRGVLLAFDGQYDEALATFDRVVAATDVSEALEALRDEERDREENPIPDYTRAEAQAYALMGVVRSAQALDSYEDYLTLVGGGADGRIQSAAGALESRFTFELRLDDGTWLLSGSFDAEEEATE